uniref:TAF7 RNA polymerase II, TATA box binding protein (TBP)-associated factor n=1 Tax=Salmo trutta TaxID=8032 RepID=A0A674B603_SALTR
IGEGQFEKKNHDDAPHELESEFVLRLPTIRMEYKYASTIKRITQSSSMNLKDRFAIELHGRSKWTHPLLVDLSCILEFVKTVLLEDRKDALIEMLVCTLDGDLYPPLEEPTGTVDPKKKTVKDKVKDFVWNHGNLCTKFERNRLFYTESPDVEKVKRLLSTDAETVSVRWVVIAEDETKEADSKGRLVNLDSSDGILRVEMRNTLGSIQLLRNLCVLRKPDAVNGYSVPPPVVMEYQVQVDGVKAKLKETGARKKQQKDLLIMKVENQVQKHNRYQALLNEVIYQEERWSR